MILPDFAALGTSASSDQVFAGDQDGLAVPAALVCVALPTVRGGYRYAEIPVSAWPRARVWISSVPS
jgi:hypothetical protein